MIRWGYSLCSDKEECCSEVFSSSAAPRGCVQGPLNGGGSNGGVSRSGFVLPFLSFFVLSRFFWDFPDLLGMVRGFSRLVLFLFLGLLRVPTRNSPERSAKQSGPFPQKVGNPRAWKPPRFSFSQLVVDSYLNSKQGS